MRKHFMILDYPQNLNFLMEKFVVVGIAEEPFY